MKIGNVEKLSPREEVAPIAREGKSTLFFHFKSSISPEKTRELAVAALREQQGSGIVRPGGKVDEIEIDPDKRLELIMAINFIKSLDAVYTVEQKMEDEGEFVDVRIEQPLTWETVDLDDYLTYPNFNKELESFGLAAGEIGFLTMKAAQVNMIDDEMVREARADFLASR